MEYVKRILLYFANLFILLCVMAGIVSLASLTILCACFCWYTPIETALHDIYDDLSTNIKGLI